MIDPRFEYIRHQILLDYRGAMMTQDAKAIKSIETEDAEKVTFTIHKEQLQPPK